MRVLLDECVAADLKHEILALGHTCATVPEAGLGSKTNGELLRLSEGVWDVLLTTDRHIKHQQNMAGRRISVLILKARSNLMVDLLPLTSSCAKALTSIQPGKVIEIVDERTRSGDEPKR